MHVHLLSNSQQIENFLSRQKSKVFAQGLGDRTTQFTLGGTPASKHLMKRAKQIKPFYRKPSNEVQFSQST